MKFETSAAMLTLMGAASARQTWGTHAMGKREVPQEHSHEKFLAGVNTALKLDNPANIQDAVFSLLGNAAAAAGAGDITNLDCLQQAVADQAFTNSKAANDVEGMTNALVFRALERNTGKVGLASVTCTETAVNPEIAAIQQHQDPASDGAAAANKAITLELAKQLAAIGADPQIALQSGTFAPGDLNDATAKGNTCDDANDTEGCIFTQNLLVEDATADEIDAAVAGVASGGAADSADNAADDSNDAECDADNAADDTATGTSGSASNSTASAGSAASTSAAASNGASDGATASGTNVQTFTGTLGGAAPPVVSSASERPFAVNGATFLNVGAALQRSCDVQHNACANAANSGQLAGGVAQCEQQKSDCDAAASSAKVRRAFRNRRQAALDTGSCGSPAIEFADGLDGRKETSFAPENTADFNHGSALNIKVISEFICGQLASKCKASQDTVDTCDQASQAAQAETGQAAADAFNNALGA